MRAHEPLVHCTRCGGTLRPWLAVSLARDGRTGTYTNAPDLPFEGEVDPRAFPFCSICAEREKAEHKLAQSGA